MPKAPSKPVQNRDFVATLEAGIRRALSAAMVGLTGKKLADTMGLVFELGGSTQEKITAKDPPKYAIACKDGCAHCCRLYVQVTPLEALHLARWLITHRTPEELAAVKARVAAADDATRGKGTDARTLVPRPCPLLADERCSAYEARPFACRGANSADPEACESVLGATERVLTPSYRHQREIWSGMVRASAAAVRDMGKRPDLLELNAALRIALSFTDPVAAWMAGLLDFTPAQCVEEARAMAKPMFTTGYEKKNLGDIR